MFAPLNPVNRKVEPLSYVCKCIMLRLSKLKDVRPEVVVRLGGVKALQRGHGIKCIHTSFNKVAVHMCKAVLTYTRRYNPLLRPSSRFFGTLGFFFMSRSG